ncbi:DUF2461 domain-containing protein [Lysobacter pythonis]|uniref:DUF2461 domain-containing protein n=1 Tax=Solilutibacter pythonis TaxID=2483112 RepID=A0A3M2I4I6_9GAMM|nr:DUF2461 domain-containing protein [Lysobacter pythonis]RMH94940.1 DUF2461 domain-containing protein [Lysobacter pythonis]
MNAYFDKAAFKFLNGLARHNNREWFQAHKADYETHVRTPFQRLLGDLQPALAAISPHFRSDPKTVGGSMFRIQRDTRYAHDKSPYKPWQGARLFHERRRQVAAPSFYVHLQPGASFVGAGLWHPETPTQRRVRQFIFENPAGWARTARDKALRRRFDLESNEMLVRPPTGFPADFEFIDDLRHRNFALARTLEDEVMTGPKLRPILEKDLAQLAPFVDYLCAALDLEF